MKAIILANAPITESEARILKRTKIFKLAINHHCESLNPDYRIVSDYVLRKIYDKFSQKIISIRDKLNFITNRVEYPDMKFKGSTIVAAIECLIMNSCKEILLVADNTVHNSDFRNTVKREINKIKHKAKIYQYSNGNFDLPKKSIIDFCNI